MRLRGRLLSCVGLMLVVPLHCEAQGHSHVFEHTFPEKIAATGSFSSPAETRAAVAPSGGRDSLLNGTLIGLAVGAACGIAFTYAIRDSDLDAGSYAYGALIFGGIGAGVGLGIDALLDRTPSVAVRSPRRVALSPRVSRKAAGIRVIMRW